MVSPVQRLTVVDSYLTCTMFPASPRRAKSPTAPQRPFLTFRTLFAYCGCVDAGYVQYSSRTCATSGATEQPTSRCVPYNEARATQECAIRFEGSRKPVGGSITPITPTGPPNNSRSSIQNTQTNYNLVAEAVAQLPFVPIFSPYPHHIRLFFFLLYRKPFLCSIYVSSSEVSCYNLQGSHCR